MTEDRIGGVRRWRTMAQTWFVKAAYRIRTLSKHENEAVRAVASWEAAELLGRVLGEAYILVPVLGEDEIGDVEQEAKELVALLRKHRLQMKLRATEGRTPEEAASFLAKADSLTP